MVDSLKLYEALKASDLTEVQAKSITEAISSALEAQAAAQDKGLATKVGSDKFDSEMHRIDATIRQECTLLGETLRKEIQTAGKETVRWMFIFWIGQAAITIGIVFTVVKALR